MFPHTVTIYNRYKDGTIEKWQRTVLSGVFWNGSKGVVMRKTGTASADGLQLIIPFSADVSRGYLKPKEFADLEDKTGHWTLAPKDMVILGKIDHEVVKSSSELTAFDDVMIIASVDTRDFGGEMAHWEVSGK